MDFTSQELGLTLMGAGITWLVAELVRREKAATTEKGERHALHQGHIADLKEQLAAQKEALDRYQAHAEKAAADAVAQERASMVVMLAMGDKMAALTSETRQTLNTALSLRSQP